MEAILNYAGNKANEIITSKVNDIDAAKRIEEILSMGYDMAVKGVPNVLKPLEEETENYSTRYSSIEKAAKAMIRSYTTASASAGFITGLGGFITLPISVSADLMSVVMMQLRMVAGLAKLGGYNLNDHQVRAFVLTCLTGQTVSAACKEAGINIGEKMAVAGVKKIPAEAIKRINQKVGFRMLTKFGETGVINLGKAVPVVGGVIGGGFDATTTSIIGNHAYKFFIENAAYDYSA